MTRTPAGWRVDRHVIKHEPTLPLPPRTGSSATGDERVRDRHSIAGRHQDLLGERTRPCLAERPSPGIKCLVATPVVSCDDRVEHDPGAVVETSGAFHAEDHWRLDRMHADPAKRPEVVPIEAHDLDPDRDGAWRYLRFRLITDPQDVQRAVVVDTGGEDGAYAVGPVRPGW